LQSVVGMAVIVLTKKTLLTLFKYLTYQKY
jgi:hypothetical protein